MADPNVDALYNQFAPGGNKKSPENSGIDVDQLYDDFVIAKPKDDIIIPPPVTPQVTAAKKFTAGVGQGASDVVNTIGLGIGQADESINRLFKNVEGAKRNLNFKNRVNTENKNFELNYGDSSLASAGRLGGQVAMTAPLVPARAVQGANAVLGAVPRMTAAGTPMAAPLANRMAGSVATGAISGGTFGAGTSAANDKSLGENIGEGVLTGAVGGPLVAGGSALAKNTVQGIRNLWANVPIMKIAAEQGLPSSSVQTIIKKLEDIGLTPQQAQTELNKLGPKATLMDLDEALSGLGRGVATTGGKATSIVKGRMEARGEVANSNTVRQIEAKLGPKPDLEVEKANVIKEAKRLTGSDYANAHSSPEKLSTSGLIDHIDSALESAVGAKANTLKEIKGYLFKDVKNADGTVSKVLKDSVKDLHEIRQGIDDIINKKGDSLPGNARRSVEGVRDWVDTLLKTNPQMKAADAKYAQHMKVAEALDIGHDVIAKGSNKEEFARLYDASPTEVQGAIKKGMRAAVGNVLDKSSQGELTGAQRLFDKNSRNRANFRHAFGSDADEILNNVHRDISFRNTERAVRGGSSTAENQAVQQELGLREKPTGAFSEGVKSVGMDIVAGTGGALSVGRGVMTGLKNKVTQYSENKLTAHIEGLGDILSRSKGQERDTALGIAARVKAIQDKTAKPVTRPNSLLRHVGERLENASSSVVGEEGIEEGKKVGNFSKEMFKRIFAQ